MCKKEKTELVRRQKSQQGFSLIELIVTMVIFLIVTGSIYGLLQAGRLDRNRSSRRSDIMKNARAAVFLIGRDALNAGLGFHRSGAVVPDGFISTTLSLQPDSDNQRDILTAVIAGNNLFQDDLNSDPNVRTDLVAFAYRDLDYNNGNPISLTGVSAGGNANIARIYASNGQNAESNIYDLFLIESDSSQVAVMATGFPAVNQTDFAPTDPLGLNQPFNGTGVNGSLLKQCTAVLTTDCTTYLASAKRFFWVSYRVTQTGTLIRTTYGNNVGQPANQQIQALPLAYNVQDLQFRYVLKDGTATDAPTDFNAIRQVTVSLKVASTETDEQTGKPEIIKLNATFSLRNIGYDAG